MRCGLTIFQFGACWSEVDGSSYLWLSKVGLKSFRLSRLHFLHQHQHRDNITLTTSIHANASVLTYTSLVETAQHFAKRPPFLLKPVHRRLLL